MTLLSEQSNPPRTAREGDFAYHGDMSTSPQNIKLPNDISKQQYEFDRQVRQALIDIQERQDDTERKVAAIGKNSR